MNSVTFPSMMMLPTVQAVPQESLASAVATKPKPVSKPTPKTYALPPPPKPPQIIAQQGPELLQKDRPIEKRESFMSHYRESSIVTHFRFVIIIAKIVRSKCPIEEGFFAGGNN